MALTVRRVERLTKPGRYGDGQGLSLQVSPSGVKSWLFRYERNGRERWMGLGPLHTVDLTEARERARKARQQLLDGIDPRDAREADRAAKAVAAARALPFEEAARQYFDSHERKWKNAKHRAQFLSTLKAYAFPQIGKLPVASIDTGLVLKCVEPLWLDKDNPRVETASRLRGRIEVVLDWATVRGYRTGDNPARWKGHLSEVLPARNQVAKPKHHAALPFIDLPEFMGALAEREGMAARAFEFTVLTAARTSETIGALWNEIDLRAKVWTVPAGRIKGGREHRVPLSDQVVKILRDLPREDGNEFVFIGPRSDGLSNMAMAALLKRMSREDITVHGFRSTFRDYCAERTDYQNHIVEMCLAHVIGDKVEAAYRRGDLFTKRARLMADWARFATTPARAGDVVPLRARRRR
jgi:integrase